MRLVAGVDSSTQSTKVLLVDADSGQIVDEGRAAHPEGTQCHPKHWWEALQKAGAGILDRAEAISVAGQQHGMVALDKDGEVIRPALLWNDTRSEPQARRLVEENGGADAWASSVGTVPPASFTITKLAWMAEHEASNAQRTAAVLLPHDWLTMKLREVPFQEATTDRSDVSGTGYWSPHTGAYLEDKLENALGHKTFVPRVAPPNESVGLTPLGALLAPGAGDNAAAALGLGLGPGDVAVSLGTSGTVFGVSAVASSDSTGIVAGFADATGAFLPLVCTLNAAKVLDTVARLLGVGHKEFDDLALSAPSASNGLTLLPYFDGERTPRRPSATGVLAGLTTHTSRADLARAAIEGVLGAQAYGLEALREHGLDARRVFLIGGAAASPAVQTIAPTVFGMDVEVPAAAQYVALGAARQAAWVLSGDSEPPQWNLPGTKHVTGQLAPSTLEQYSTLQKETAPWVKHNLANAVQEQCRTKTTLHKKQRP